MKVLLYQFHLKTKKRGQRFSYGNDLGADYGDYWEISIDSCKKYAEKYGFDYKLLSPTEEEWEPFFISEPQFESYRAIDFLKDYDAVLYIDTDVIVKPNSPNVVERYRSDQTNVVVNTCIGNNLLGERWGAINGYNTGVVIWYNDSYNIKNLRDEKPKNWAYRNGHFILGDFIEDRKHLRWWHNLEDYKPFLGKFKSGMHNDERFMGFLINTFMLPASHLHEKFNYIIDWSRSPKRLPEALSENVHFVHYCGPDKQYMKEHYKLFTEVKNG